VTEGILTYSGDNLCLQSKLVLETTSKITYSTLAVTRNIRDLADMIEHVPAREEKNRNQADCGPKVAILYHRNDIGCCNGEEGHKS
jgi:hypothetical protein